MQDNILLEENEQNGFQVLCTGITWNKNSIRTYSSKKDSEELPSQFVLEIPETVLIHAKKKNNNFNDIIESFVYNLLTRKFLHEVYSCSIWLPLNK